MGLTRFALAANYCYHVSMFWAGPEKRFGLVCAACGNESLGSNNRELALKRAVKRRLWKQKQL